LLPEVLLELPRLPFCHCSLRGFLRLPSKWRIAVLFLSRPFHRTKISGQYNHCCQIHSKLSFSICLILRNLNRAAANGLFDSRSDRTIVQINCTAGGQFLCFPSDCHDRRRYRNTL
jgi:hypothetical protein